MSPMKLICSGKSPFKTRNIKKKEIHLKSYLKQLIRFFQTVVTFRELVGGDLFLAANVGANKRLAWTNPDILWPTAELETE